MFHTARFESLIVNIFENRNVPRANLRAMKTTVARSVHSQADVEDLEELTIGTSRCKLFGRSTTSLNQSRRGNWEQTHLGQDSQGSWGLEIMPGIVLEEYPELG